MRLLILFLSLTAITVAHASTKSIELNIKPEAQLHEAEAETLGVRENGIGLAIGQSVQSFTAVSHLGIEVAFDSLYANGPALVIFYRGGWCPYCNVQIQQLTQAFSSFNEVGVTPVLISADTPNNAALAQRQYEIPFPVLSDPDLKAHASFEVIYELPWIKQQAYKAYGIDLAAWSGRTDAKFAVSSAFIVDSKGTIRWAHSNLDYTRRPSVEQLLGVISSLDLSIDEQ